MIGVDGLHCGVGGGSEKETEGANPEDGRMGLNVLERKAVLRRRHLMAEGKWRF